MADWIYNEVGTTFQEGELTLMVVESEDGGRTCAGCWYNYKFKNKKNYAGSCYQHRHACTAHTRKDKKQVVFSKVG